MDGFTLLYGFKVTHHSIGEFALAYNRHRPAVSGSPRLCNDN
jgi:hypothetical protein